LQLNLYSFFFFSSRKCFPEYQGKDEYTEASEYIQAQFVAQNKSEQKVSFYQKRFCCFN
jgi:hypothetical protein